MLENAAWLEDSRVPETNRLEDEPVDPLNDGAGSRSPHFRIGRRITRRFRLFSSRR